MNKQKLLGSLVIAAIIASLVLGAVACQPGLGPTATPASSGSIEGVVTGANGTPVVGMRLGIVKGTAPYPEIGPITNNDGAYRFPAIPPGIFDVAVHDVQGNRMAVQSVEVRSGEASKLDFALTTLP